MTNLIKFLPGDLVYNKYSEEYGIIIKVGNHENSTVITESSFDISNFSGLKKLCEWEMYLRGRIFNPNVNYLCCENNCIVKSVIGECLDCKYKENPYSDKVYFIGDTVFMKKFRTTGIVTGVALRIETSEFSLYNSIITCRPYYNLRGDDVFSIYDQFLNNGAENFTDKIDIVKIWNDLKTRNRPSLEYILDDNSYSWNEKELNIRKRNCKYVFIPPEAKNICDICVCGGTEECLGCKTEKLISKL